MSAFDQGWRAFQEGRPLDAYPMGHVDSEYLDEEERAMQRQWRQGWTEAQALAAADLAPGVQAAVLTGEVLRHVRKLYLTWVDTGTDMDLGALAGYCQALAHLYGQADVARAACGAARTAYQAGRLTEAGAVVLAGGVLIGLLAASDGVLSADDLTLAHPWVQEYLTDYGFTGKHEEE